MTIHLFVPASRSTSTTVLAVLAIAAVTSTAPPAAHAADQPRTPLLAQGTGMGDQPSARVRVVQRALRRHGYDLGAPGADGRFGPLTEAAVGRMQADHALAVDGVVGQETRTALRLTRRAVGQAERRATDRAKAVHVPWAMPSRPPAGPSVAGATAPRDSAVYLGYYDGAWSNSLLAGAMGGLVALLFVIAISVGRRSRHGGGPIASAPSVEPPPARATAPRRVIGYLTVGPDRRATDDRAAAAIRATCQRSGWQLLEIVRDREVGPTLERPALGYALARIADRQADALVVSDLQRLSRSIVDLGALMAWFRRARAVLIALDLGIDTSTPKGRRVASTIIALSDDAHQRMANRSRSRETGVDVARRPGRPAVRHDPELLEGIAAMRAAGMTLQAIADQLNAEDVPTLRGGAKWRPSSIQAALGYRRPGPRDHLPSLDHETPRP